MGQNVLSFGCGLNSMAILTEGAKRGELPDRVLFAEVVDSEHPETMAYLHKVAIPYIESLGLKLEIVRAPEAGGSLVKYCQETGMVPVRVARWCTKVFKVLPLINAQSYGDVQWIGIDAGESHRANKAHNHRQHRDKGLTNRYPLIEWGIDRAGCEKSIKEAGLPLPIKSGCYFCPFARWGHWIDLAARHPDLFEIACSIEENGTRFKDGSYLMGHRNNKRMSLRAYVEKNRDRVNQGKLIELNEFGGHDDIEACAVCELMS